MQEYFLPHTCKVITQALLEQIINLEEHDILIMLSMYQYT